MYYWLKTLSHRGRNRLRPLSGQTLDGNPVVATLNCQGNKEMRTEYPLGTIFVTTEFRLHASRKFYVCGDMFPVSTTHVKPEHAPTEDMLNSYIKEVAHNEKYGKATITPIEETPTAPVKKTFLSKLQNNKSYNVPKISEEGFYVEKDVWYLLLRNIINQVNTMLIGQTGSGKTELIIRACEKIGMPCHVYDMGSMLDPVSSLLGVHRLREGGVSTFDYARFTEEITEPCVILLDELSRAPASTNNILFPCLDSRRELRVEIAGGKDTRTIKVHPEVTFIATANVGSEYTGTQSMDKALVNRFFPIELDYLSDKYEAEVLVKRCGVTIDEARKIANLTKSVRDLYSRQQISCSISTRETLMAAELVADGWSVVEAVEKVFLPLYEGTSSEGERSVVKRIIMSF